MNADERLPYVAVLANWRLGADKKYHLNLFLGDPDDLPRLPYIPQMGEAFDQLTCRPDFAPASVEERANNPRKTSTTLHLAPDEILPWAWPDGWWKVRWLTDHELAAETGRFHTMETRSIPIMQLTESFFHDTIRALNGKETQIFEATTQP